MDMIQAQSIDAYVALKLPPKPEPVQEFKSNDIETVAAPAKEPDQNALPPKGDASQFDIASVGIAQDLRKKLEASMRGEMDFSMIGAPKGGKPANVSDEAYKAVLAAGGDPSGLTEGDWKRLNENPGIAEAWKNENGPEWSSAQLADQRAHDPLVFDLNGDGDTDATVNQHGINVDGATDTKWAEKGDGVLAFGDKPIGTVDSSGGKHQDAYGTLKAEAEKLGIDTSKGYLNTDDLKKLEANGLTMMVSNGDGTNQSMKPTELGITQMSLGGKAVDKTDVAGNAITTEGSFVRNGQTQLVNDMWLNDL